MSVRPRLRPGLRRAWRDPTSLQVGVFPGPGVVLAGLRAGDEAVIAALDGAHDLQQVREVAVRHRVETERVDDLLALLSRSGLLAGAARGAQVDRAHLSQLGGTARARLQPDSEAWSLVHDGDGLLLAADRGRRRVVVHGAGRVGATIATTLLAAGVGSVTVVDARPVRAGDVLPSGAQQRDVGGSWTQMMAGVPARVGAAPPSRPGIAPPRRAGSLEPDLVVLVSDHVLDARVGDDLVRRTIDHLGVVVDAARVVIGPLVLPGRSPCIRCLDLHRRDRDPAWLHLVAQLLDSRAPQEAVGETALSTAAGALAALQVLCRLDRKVTPDAVGRTLELTLPDGQVQRRAWRLHAQCGCARLPANAPTGPGRSPDTYLPARE